MAGQVIHDPEQQKFFLVSEGKEAFLMYKLCSGNVIDFTYTYVPPELRGGSIAARLAEAGLTYAAQAGYRIAASCSYIQNYIHSHPCYRQDLQVRE